MADFHEAFSLAGEIAVITGGGSGLGLGVAQAFVAAGAKVVVVGRRTEVLHAAVEQLGPSASFEAHDVTAFDQAPDLIRRVADRAGQPTILVNNAGIHLKKAAVNTTEAEFRLVMDTHVTAAFALSRAVAPAMVERGHGSLLFMASMASYFGIPNVIAYSAAKSAYLGLVRSFAVELAPAGVRVNGIAPGWIDTPMTSRAMDNDPLRRARVLQRTPMGRLGSPSDIGWAAVYLCSPAAGFVNGVVLPIDGGALIGF
jgi:NAD(P)-dependent dehydrogenase (short-subunit alcohol dehydrogenase family)